MIAVTRLMRYRQRAAWFRALHFTYVPPISCATARRRFNEDYRGRKFEFLSARAAAPRSL